jgi:hypothetical protein
MIMLLYIAACKWSVRLLVALSATAVSTTPRNCASELAAPYLRYSSDVYFTCSSSNCLDYVGFRVRALGRWLVHGPMQQRADKLS